MDKFVDKMGSNVDKWKSYIELDPWFLFIPTISVSQVFICGQILGNGIDPVHYSCVISAAKFSYVVVCQPKLGFGNIHKHLSRPCYRAIALGAFHLCSFIS